MQLTRTHRILIGVVVTGAVVIAAIGFAGSYAAVRDLARDKGFGDFANVFPIGIDAGIVVLLALDLLLTWIRIPFPLLRQTAWLLTAATIAFNGAAAWPDPLGVGMHAVIPVLFVVSVEAARHAVGRIADITADRHMEPVRIARWLLAPLPTFRLWRRMKLWELRSYDEVIRLEQDRLVYRARLRARYGRAWRRKAPVESLMPLRLARYGVPLADTTPAGLTAAGLRPTTVPVEHADAQLPVTQPDTEHERALDADAREIHTAETGHQDLSGAPGSVNGNAAAMADPAPTPSVDYYEATHAYVAQYGSFPNAAQLGLFLLDAYNMTDPATGGPVTEEQLRPVLQELRQLDREPAEKQPVADESAVSDRPTNRGSATGEGLTGVGEAPVPEELPMDTMPTAAAGQPSASQQHQESELPTEEEQNRVIAGWLDEAEAAGKKLSGAEVGRRLDVSPRTGQRALNKAKDYREAQQRQPVRGHLRSVSNGS